MPRRIAANSLNASTLDIMNVIRENASWDYQQNVPIVESTMDIPKVGEVIYGTPSFANQFLNSLVNRIASVRMQSATFNNPYTALKKGYIEYGETIEEIFAQIAKVVEFDAAKGAAREFRRTYPDVRSAFHTMNWRVMYPVTIQDEDLRMAFLSADGVSSLIAKIVDTVYTAAEYDEFLLFKYLLIKGVNNGNFKPIEIGDGTDFHEAAYKFRGTSNILPFMSSDYNIAAVKTTTPKERQIIFMDAYFNAQFDVDVLASAFNMDKADFMGRLYLIDDFTKFDNDRFEVIRAHSDGIEAVTDEELAFMANIKALILDENWFQVYDNNNKFTEKYVASGLYWNYFYHVWKTVSISPFSNAVAFIVDGKKPTVTPVLYVTGIDTHQEDTEGKELATAASLIVCNSVTGKQLEDVHFVQTLNLIEAGIAITDFGAVYYNTTTASGNTAGPYTITAVVNGDTYEFSGVVFDENYGTAHAGTPVLYSLKPESEVATTSNKKNESKN